MQNLARIDEIVARFLEPAPFDRELDEPCFLRLAEILGSIESPFPP